MCPVLRWADRSHISREEGPRRAKDKREVCPGHLPDLSTPPGSLPFSSGLRLPFFLVFLSPVFFCLRPLSPTWLSLLHPSPSCAVPPVPPTFRSSFPPFPLSPFLQPICLPPCVEHSLPTHCKSSFLRARNELVLYSAMEFARITTGYPYLIQCDSSFDKY